MTPAVLAGFTGVLQGARHALEPDHVTAVATVMVESPSPRRGMFYAGCWGLGHASMLLLVAGPLVAMRVHLPEPVTGALELAVGAMLVYLGVRSLRGREVHAHRHDGPVLERGRRPFAIGLVHGLAGSGALAALIALGAPSVATGLACLALYAFGTVVGMVGLAAVAGPVLVRAGRLPALARWLIPAAGVASIGMGALWILLTLLSLAS